MRRWSFLMLLLLSGAGTAATGGAPDRVVVRDISDSTWREGSVVVHAPIREVREWMRDYSHWPEHFPDVRSAEVLGVQNGDPVVRMKSHILGRQLTLRFHDVNDELQTYEGSGKGVTVQGKNYFESLGPNTTRVTLQTSAEVHGGLKAIASESMQRSRAYKKLRADLNAILALERRDHPPSP